MSGNEARKVATRWASKQLIKSRSHREILRTLAWLTAGCGAVSHQTIMRRAKCSRRTVVRAIAEFKKRGLIICRSQRGARGRQGANLYTLNINQHLVSRVPIQPASRVPNGINFQEAKMAPLYLEVNTNQHKNEPRETYFLGDTYQEDGYVHCVGWWPSDADATDLATWSDYDPEVPA